MSDKTTYETRVTQITFVPKGQPIFSEMATKIQIIDETGGEFVNVSQGSCRISIDPKEWPALREAINKMIGDCR